MTIHGFGMRELCLDGTFIASVQEGSVNCVDGERRHSFYCVPFALKL